MCKYIDLVAECLYKKKHCSVPQINFPDYDNENISTNITLKSEHREKVNLLGNMTSNSRNNDDFHCLMSKTEAYVLELLNQMKICIEFDKEVLLHTAKQLCSLKNTFISSKNTSKQKH